MNEDDFKEIKKWLERGQILQLAREYKISPKTAYRRLSGKSKNLAFVEEVRKIALENKQRFKSGMERMKTLDAA